MLPKTDDSLHQVSVNTSALMRASLISAVLRWVLRKFSVAMRRLCMFNSAGDALVDDIGAKELIIMR